MRCSKRLAFIASFVGSFLGATIALLSFLPGESKASPGATVKEWEEFRQSCSVVNNDDIVKFAWACHAQLSGDHFQARTLYNELLNRHPENPVILHNLQIME